MANEIALQEGLGIPSLPVVPTTLPITITRPRTQEQVEAARQELIPRQELATSARSDIRTIQEARQAEKRKIERKALEEREIDLLKLEKERPIPKELPTFESPKKTFDELFSVLMVGAMTASGAGKSNFMAAANSMIGAMEGYQKGKKNEFDQAVKEFNISLKKALQEEKINNAKYQQIWASRKLTIQEKFNQTMLQADAAQDKITAAIARLGDVDKLERRIADKEKELKSIDDARIKAEDELKRDRQRAADRAFAAEIARRERESREKLAREDRAFQNLGPALRNIASSYEDPEQTTRQLLGASADDKKRIQGAYRAMQESETVADFVARNPQAVGALAVARNYIRLDAIRSLQSQDESTVVNAKATLVDRGIDEAVRRNQITPDAAESAKVMQKMLFALALADVQGSGQRGSVYLDRQFQNLYDQASRQDTLLKIIRERASENNRNLGTYNLNIERNLNRDQFPLSQAHSDADVRKYLRDRLPLATKQDVIDTARGQNITEDEARKRLKSKGYRIEGE